MDISRVGAVTNGAIVRGSHKHGNLRVADVAGGSRRRRYWHRGLDILAHAAFSFLYVSLLSCSHSFSFHYPKPTCLLAAALSPRCLDATHPRCRLFRNYDVPLRRICCSIYFMEHIVSYERQKKAMLCQLHWMVQALKKIVIYGNYYKIPTFEKTHIGAFIAPLEFRKTKRFPCCPLHRLCL